MKSGAALRHMTESRWRGRFWNIFTTVGAKTLFATHYHELIGGGKLPHASNFSVGAGNQNGIVFCIRFYQVQSIAVTESKWQLLPAFHKALSRKPEISWIIWKKGFWIKRSQRKLKKIWKSKIKSECLNRAHIVRLRNWASSKSKNSRRWKHCKSWMN